MNYGLYLASSGALTSMYRMDVMANNLANSETVGFKAAVPAVRQRDAASVEDNLPFMPSNKMLERLGGGVMLMPNRLSLKQGTPESTKRPLDVAISGEGYLVVRQGQGTSPDTVRFTRDGRMTINSKGQLVQSGSGLPLLDQNDLPINMSPGGNIEIGPTGEVKQNGQFVARLQLATVSDPSALRAAGDGLMTGPSRMIAKRTAASGEIEQGFVERSTVDSVRTMVDFAAAERDVNTSLKLISTHDQMMDRAINTFGRVA